MTQDEEDNYHGTEFMFGKQLLYAFILLSLYRYWFFSLSCFIRFLALKLKHWK